MQGGPRERVKAGIATTSGRIAGLAALALLFFAGLPLARAQQPAGKEATVPPPETRQRRFVLDYEGAVRHVVRDGDPLTGDAPLVIAVAGGAKLWFDNRFLTAKNLLVWIDPDSLEDGAAERPDEFPYGVEAPIERRGPPSEDFAAVNDLDGPPPQVAIGRVREIYAEGDVYIAEGKKRIFQAERAYFNLIENRSLIINGEIRTDLESMAITPGAEEEAKEEDSARDERERPVPIVIRAAEIRGVSKGLYEADNAKVTTCTFAEPGYHIAMDKAVYEEQVTRLGGQISGYGNRFVLGDVPLLSLPYFTIRTGVESPLPLIGFSAGVSSQYGLYVKTRWGNAFEELGNEVNRRLGIEGSFSGLWFADVNLYTARGLGIGGGVEYETRDKYFGKTEFFVIYDMRGEDTKRGYDEDRQESHSGFRGHFKTQNRFFLPDDWQLDTELNYVSDRNFLKEFKEKEFDEEKEPETYAYLKKQDGDTAVTATARFRLNTWQTQTQYLPQVTYDVISRPIASFPDFGEYLGMPEPVRLYWTHRSEAAFVNRLIGSDADEEEDDDDEYDAGSALRVDNIDRLNMPFEVGDFGFDPYFENRVTAWLGDADEDGGGGGLREGMTIGFNANTQYSRTDPDVESEYWNIHGIRHILIPSLRYRWTFLSTRESRDLVQYDSVERFDRLHVLVPGLNSRYQTKRMTRRGPETVTFFEYDVQQPLVFDNAREDDPQFLGDLHFEARYRPDLDQYLLRNSYFRLITDLNWNDAALDTFRAEFRTEPGPDFFTRLAYSYARRGRVSPTLALEGFPPTNVRDEPLNALTFEIGYQATRLWEFVFLEQLDISGAGGGETRAIVRRSTHDWLFEFGLGTGGGGGVNFAVSPIAFFERKERERFRSALSDGYDLTPIFDEPTYAAGPAFGSQPTFSGGPPEPPVQEVERP